MTCVTSPGDGEFKAPVPVVMSVPGQGLHRCYALSGEGLVAAGVA